MSLLVGVAGRWRMIAEGLEFDEDLIDEIDTNNERDEDCLQDCVEKWISRLQPSWEKLSLLLTDLEEEDLAQQTGSGGRVYVLVVAIVERCVSLQSCTKICLVHGQVIQAQVELVKLLYQENAYLLKE